MSLSLQIPAFPRPRDEVHVGERISSLEFGRYIAAARHSLLFVDKCGCVVLCTGLARDLVGISEGEAVEGRSLDDLAMACTGFGERLAPFTDPALPTSFECFENGRTLHVDIQPASGGGWAATIEDISVRRAGEISAAELARLDPLTGLPNRLLLRERLEEALARLRMTGDPCALLLVDLDRFKPVNDTLGHPVGDALLIKVADRLRSAVRGADTVARIGGDEFVVLQTNAKQLSDTQALARRLVDLLSRTYMVEGQLLTIGASIGIALAPADGNDANSLLKNADLALYRAKSDGRGTFTFFEPAMDARMQARRQLELDMRQALARREFELHYQPQLNLEKNSLTGCEALLRWRHPERGMVSPVDFIPLAEEIGLIVPIGEWVIRQA